VAGNLEQARTLIGVAGTEVAEARADLTGRGAAAAVVSGRAAEDAMTQAERMLDGFTRLESELAEAASRIPASRADLAQDLAEARTMGPDIAGPVARAEAALAAAEQAAAGPRSDPIGALRLLDEAGTTLEQGMVAVRADRERRRTAASALEQALLMARSAVAAAEDFIGTRRGAVGATARTRLAEAQRHLQLAGGGGDPAAALGEAQQADALARQALDQARSDVDRWQGGQGGAGGGLGVDLGSLVLGGILSGAFGGEYRRGGGYGGGYGGGFGGSFGGGRGGGFGGRSPGSFGGSATRGRRGGGGRF